MYTLGILVYSIDRQVERVPGCGVHAFNSSIPKAEAGGCLGVGSQLGVHRKFQAKSGLHSETL